MRLSVQRTLLAGVASLLIGTGPALGQSSATEPPSDLVTAFELADDEINRVYQQVKATIPEDRFLDLRETQRAWIRYRDAMASERARFDRGWPAEDDDLEAWPGYWQHRTAITIERTDYLRGWLRAYDGTFAHRSQWEGEWVDSFGGVLRIRQLGPSRLAFELDVVRGPTAHLGSVAGNALIEGDSAQFLEFIRPDQCKAGLSFHHEEPVLRVEGSGCISLFHGARAYFDGAYARVGEVSSVERLADAIPSNGAPTKVHPGEIPVRKRR